MSVSTTTLILALISLGATGRWRSAEGVVLLAAALGGVAQATLHLAWQAFPLVAVTLVATRYGATQRNNSECRRFFPTSGVFRPRLVGGVVGLSQAAVASLICVGSAAAITAYINESGSFAFVPPTEKGIALLMALALLNALTEELVWRGMALSICLRAGMSRPLSVVLQALSFGIAHYSAGFPGGLIGVCLAVTFGLALGLLTVWSRSLLLPLLSHWFVDFFIAWSIVNSSS